MRTTCLPAEYGKNATVLKNLFTFKGARNDLGGYDGAESFADAFPFVGYQFEAGRRTSSTGCATRAARGSTWSAERSMLSGFQEVAQALEELRDQHARAPLWTFYNTVQSFLEGYHRRVIDRAAAAARDGAGLEEYDVAVLKLLFLIKRRARRCRATWTTSPPSWPTTCAPTAPRCASGCRPQLQRLERENYITRNGECYLFLTDDEQEIARQIAALLRWMRPSSPRRRPRSCSARDLRDAQDHRRQEQLPRGGMAGTRPA